MSKDPALINVEQLGDAIARGLASIAPAKEIKEGDPEYVARQAAEGWFDDFYGKRVFQNAYEAQARGLSEEIRRRTAALVPGTYLHGRVTVEVLKNGEVIRLLYPVSGDNMLRNQALWRDFPDLINQLWAEMHPAG